MYIYIFAHVKEIGLRQNTRVINAHSCLSTTYSFSPLVLCSLVPNPHLPSQVFPLITDFINSQHYWVSCFSYFHNSYREKKQQQQKNKKTKTPTKTKKKKRKKKEINQNFRLKRLGKPQYIFIIFLFFSLPIYLAFSLT